MSFSSDIKNEIVKNSIQNTEEADAVLYASFASIGLVGLSSSGMHLKLSYENLPTARFISNLLETYHSLKCGIVCTKENLNTRKSYRLMIEGRDIAEKLLSELGFPEGSLFVPAPPPQKYTDSREMTSAFIRGLFISCGTISHPKKDYHAEFVLTSEEMAGFIKNILSGIGLISKIISRNAAYVVYLKGGDNISALLSILGAFTALLDFENIRAIRDMRNNINRAANCETANFTKTYSSAQQQLKAIATIDRYSGLNSLSAALVEVAELRREYPESSLSELSGISGISKSALNHRMRKIREIAESLQEG